jgi:Leucine-rich repeat (LRR) protein
MDNDIRGDDFGELIPGLRRFKDLRSLYISRDRFTSIVGGQFDTQTKLSYLFLNNNKIQRIKYSAFFIPLLSSEVYQLNIYLGFNMLTSASFDPNHGLDSIKARVSLGLQNNYIETLDKFVFETFLNKTTNEMKLTNNPIICDSRVKWLKDRKSFYEPRVIDANCVNDPGNTIFNSSYVDM